MIGVATYTDDGTGTMTTTESSGTGPEVADAGASPVGGRLAALVVAYALTHHVGTVLSAAGEVGPGMRVADVADLLTPWLTIGLAAWVLIALRPSTGIWVLFGVGSVLLVDGHGIHLAANSIDNVQPEGAVGDVHDLTYLWDEHVGHYLWYSGVAVVALALLLALRVRPPFRGPWPYLLGLLVALTHFDNDVEGQTPVLGITAALVLAALGWRYRDTAARAVGVAYAMSLVLFVVFGLWQGGFPEFSKLGWI
jgi:hypothetical protein